MTFITPILESLCLHLSKTRFGSFVYYCLLWCYQHVRLIIKRLSRKTGGSPKPFKLFYFTNTKNFGDVLNEELMRHFGIDYDSVESYDANLICIGSVLDELLQNRARTLRFSKEICVLGSGFMMPREDPKERFNRPVGIYALRGKLSLERCEGMLHTKLQDVVLGDPGLLVRKFFPHLQKKHEYDVGLICHLKDRGSKLLDNIQLKDKKILKIDVALSPFDFCSKVTSCDFILSSALHGLICADAFGIPNKWLVISGHVEGGGYKFRDYYSVYESIEMPQPVDLRKTVIEDRDVDRFQAEYADVSPQVERICDGLERAFGKVIADRRLVSGK